MYRLVRLNEVQYTDSEYQKDRLLSEGFLLDEAAPEDLVKLPKAELLVKAAALGLGVTEQNTKAEILAALQG